MSKARLVDIDARCRRTFRTALVFVVAMFASLAVASSAGAALDSKGTDFWLAFMNNADRQAELSLFITGDVATSGTVEIPGLSFAQPFTVTPGTVTTVAIPPGAIMSGSDTVQARGIHVSAADEVTVYGLNRSLNTTDAYLGLPTDVLNTQNREHIVLSWNVGAIGGSELAIAATQSGTTVTITPSVTVGSHPAGTPYTVNLNSGEVYQLQAAPGSDLSGTVVTANNPVAVWGGHVCANIPNAQTFACDHVVEQIPPTESWGESFVTEPLATRQGGDTFRILASEDNTTVSLNGSQVATLNRGQFHEQLITAASVITADKPVLVAQYSNGTTFDNVTSDPFMMLIPPFEQFLGSYTVTTPASGFRINYVNVVAPNGAVGQIRLDGTTIPASSFAPIGSSGFSGAQVEVSLGSHTFTADQPVPFGVFVYGFDNADSYGYPGGLSLAPVARVTSVTLTPETATNTVGTQHCVDATVRDQNNATLAGVRVDFEVTGPNPTAGFESSNQSGVARFCYTGTNTGDDTITARVGSLSDTAAKRWVLTPSLDCSGVQASVMSLWPPNHKFRLITLPSQTSGGSTVTFRVTGVTQDEPVNAAGDGNTTPDAKAGPTSNGVYLRAERSGKGDGRVYRIAFEASDGQGGTCTGTTTVGVPHDKGKGKNPVDSGQSYNSFGG